MSIEMVAARGLARLIDLIHSNSLSSFSLHNTTGTRLRASSRFEAYSY
jgi:hypothetical protein